MKTKIIRILGLLPIFLMAITFTSCEEVYLDVDMDGSSDRRYKTEYLCSRVWVDEWEDDNGTFYRQELRFWTDYCGEDYLYSEDRWGYETESSYRFDWDWRNTASTSIRLRYGPGDYSYMERISMGDNRLTCWFDGQSAYFVGR